MKDAKSLLLVLLSLGLTATWVYHLYDKSQYATQNKVPQKDTTTTADTGKDSVQQLYASTVNEIKEQAPDSAKQNLDSLKTQLDSRLVEISKLRNEISTILSNKKLSKSELLDAKGKITELRSRIEEIQDRNTSLEEQQKKLNDELGQLNTAMIGLEDNMNRLGAENKELKEKINDASTLEASEMRLSFIDIKAGGTTEVETTKAKRADKFVVSFIVQNNIAQFENTEVVVVITGPGGQVITNEVWESGNFQTKKEGTKIYTRKLKFDYSKNEEKRLIFSLDYDNFKKGEYRMKLYHNGVQIGETSKTLS